MLRFIRPTIASPGPGHQLRWHSVDLSLMSPSAGPDSTRATRASPASVSACAAAIPCDARADHHGVVTLSSHAKTRSPMKA
jgi:hypothetical protein